MNENALVMVDDNEIDLKVARMFLQKSILKNQFVGLRSGEELLTYLEGVSGGKIQVPAIILLDVNMSPMDGHMTLEKVKEQPEFKEVPLILMFSNSDFKADLERAKKNGAGYKVKPQGAKDYIDFFNSLA